MSGIFSLETLGNYSAEQYQLGYCTNPISKSCGTVQLGASNEPDGIRSFGLTVLGGPILAAVPVNLSGSISP